MPLLWISIAFIAGILLGRFTPVNWWIWGLSGLLLFLLYFINRFSFHKRIFSSRIWLSFPISPLLLLFALCLGAARYAVSVPTLTSADLAWYNNRGEYSFVGTVTAPPDIRTDKTLYEIEITELTDPENPDYALATRQVTGIALVTTTRWTDWEYGDQLLFRGEPRTPAVFPGFSYKDYLARQRIFSVIYYPQDVEKVGTIPASGFHRGLLAFRENARRTIFALFPQPESGLLAGILLGLENYLPASLEQAYRDTGTSHIIAISGFNMTIIATMLIYLFSRLFRPYIGVLIAIVGIALYSVFVDGSASVIRAAIMASTAAVGHLIGRRQSGLHALVLTAAVMCLVNPNLPWDVSFQLSFMATLGLVLFAQPMQEFLHAQVEKRFGEEKAAKISSPISEYFLFTLAAQFTTLPVIAIQFERISLVVLLANPLILPAQPAILIMGMLTTLTGSLVPVVGKILAMFTWPLLKYTNFVVSTLGEFKGDALNLHPVAAIWILVAVILVLLVFILRNYFKKKLGGSLAVWSIVLLIAGCFSVWSIYFHQPDGFLHIRQIRSSDTSFVIFETSAGNTYLFDLVGDPNETSAALTPLLSPWNYHLDGIVLIQPSSEIALADLNTSLAVNSILAANSILRPAAGEYPLSLPESTNLINLSSIAALEIEEGISLSVIAESPGKAAYMIQYGHVSIVIPAGVDYALIRDAHPGLLEKADLLILSPSDTSYIPPRLWSQLEPGILLWNSLDPSPFSSSLSTSESESISIISDGSSIWLEKP